MVTQDGQEIKVCVRTYRLFYVPEKEDYLWKFRSKEEVEGAAVNLKKRNVLRKRWLEKSKVMPPFLPLKKKEKEVVKETGKEKEKEIEVEELKGKEKAPEKETESLSSPTDAAPGVETPATPPTPVVSSEQKEPGEISDSKSIPASDV